MPAFDLHIVFDCADPDRVARFWMAALGVPEVKQVKNRVHLDIKVAKGLSGAERRTAIETEADRLVGLGAGVAERFDEPDGFHILMRDPEGNEFCLA